MAPSLRVNATRKVLERGLGEHCPPVPVPFTREFERVPPGLGTRQGHHNFQRLLGSAPLLASAKYIYQLHQYLPSGKTKH